MVRRYLSWRAGFHDFPILPGYRAIGQARRRRGRVLFRDGEGDSTPVSVAGVPSRLGARPAPLR